MDTVQLGQCQVIYTFLSLGTKILPFIEPCGDEANVMSSNAKIVFDAKKEIVLLRKLSSGPACS